MRRASLASAIALASASSASARVKLPVGCRQRPGITAEDGLLIAQPGLPDSLIHAAKVPANSKSLSRTAAADSTPGTA